MKGRAYGQAIAGAACWGAIGLFTRTLAAGGLSPQSIVTVRVTGAALLLSLLFLARDRKVFRVKLRHLGYFFGTGVISVTFFTWCYFSCMEQTSLAVAAGLLYTAPVFVVVLSALLWKEPLTGRKTAALCLAVLGCALVAGLAGGRLAVTPAGLLLGLGSGFFYALYSVFSRYALACYTSATVTVYTFYFASAASLLIFLRPEELRAGLAQPKAAAASLLLVVVSTVVPYLLYTASLAQIEAGQAAILACVEPVTASLISIFVFREAVAPGSLIGIACVLGAVLLLREPNRQRRHCLSNKET